MEAILAAGKKSKAAIIRDYAESTVAVANIKVAVRCCKTGKSLEFMKRAMAPCKTLNVERLAHAALVGLDAVMEYLNGAGYAEAAEALKESPSAFEPVSYTHLWSITASFLRTALREMSL